MSVTDYFPSVTATNTRRTTVSPTGGDTVATVSSFIGILRPVTDVAKLYVENNIGNEFDFISDEDVDIKVGDDLYISSNKYSVLGVADFEDLEDDSDSYTNIRLSKKRGA